MTCYQHPTTPAAARCAQCGKEICMACAMSIGDKTLCRDCAETLRKQSSPTAEDSEPEIRTSSGAPEAMAAPAHENVERPAEKPAEAPASHAVEPTVMPVPATPSTVAPVAKPAATAAKAHDPGAGGKRAKEPLLSAALSLILPGAGQAYNGNLAKGLILAVIYLGSLAIIFGGLVIVALGARRIGSPETSGCCCLPLLIIPMITLIYAIFDAYNTAEKINNNQPVKEWP